KRLKLSWSLSVAALAGVGIWVVIFPIFSGEFHGWATAPASLVHLIQQRDLLKAWIKDIFSLATAGLPANCAFLALLASMGLAGILGNNATRLKKIVLTAIAGIAPNLMLLVQIHNFYMWCAL